MHGLMEQKIENIYARKQSLLQRARQNIKQRDKCSKNYHSLIQQEYDLIKNKLATELALLKDDIKLKPTHFLNQFKNIDVFIDEHKAS